MKTLAAILVEQRRPLEIAELEIPSLRYGQVLVEIAATRICGSQIGEIQGAKGPDKYLPHLLGHEAGGIVRDVGPEVRHVKVGDRVVIHWRPGRGIEAGGSTYLRADGSKINSGNITTFQQFSVVSENRLTPVPADLDFEICALLADTLTTGFGVITHDAKVRIGESVVIIGCGGIGLGAVLGAHLAGAYPVIAVDIHEHKLAKARAYGATHVINSSTIDFRSAVQTLLGGSADVVIDGTGLPAVIEQAFALTAPTGRCVIFGVMAHDKAISLNTLPLHFGKVLTGSHGGGSQPAEDIPRLVRMLRAGRFNPAGFVTDRLPLENVNDAVARMRSGEIIHAMIHFPLFAA
jgi:S-(hydroxymethyl)glutathione dehydrogenase/alcohol dehydrogenase